MKVSSQYLAVDLFELCLVVVGDLLTGNYPVEGPELEDLQLVVPAGRPQNKLQAVQELTVMRLQGRTVQLQVGGQAEDGRLEGGVAALGQVLRHLAH